MTINKKENNENRAIRILVPILLLLTVLYFIVWILFIGEGPLPTGEGLAKSDWLSFIVSAVGGLTTFALGIVTYLQNKKIEEIYNESNDISKKMLKLEQNKVRPYIEISDKYFDFAISKASYGFSDDYYHSVNGDIRFEGNVVRDEENYNSCYPSTMLIGFEIENTGHAKINDFYLSRFSLLDGVIGDVKYFTCNINSSLLKGRSKVQIEIRNKINMENVDEENIEQCNNVTNHYKESLEKNFRLGFLELGFKYTDIYGEEYEQEYTVHYKYDIDKETDNELILNVSQLTIEHHIDRSPYGPRDI